MKEVTLESEIEGLEAHVAVEWERADGREGIRSQALVALAGAVAELVFRGEDVLEDPTLLWSWSGDWDEAREQLARLKLDARAEEAELRSILDELHVLFRGPCNYERLARVADALDAHGTLDRGLFLEAIGELD